MVVERESCAAAYEAACLLRSKGEDTDPPAEDIDGAVSADKEGKLVPLLTGTYPLSHPSRSFAMRF